MLTKAEQFFYDHAGYSWNPMAGETQEQSKIRCSKALAKAESLASEDGARFIWQDDYDDSSDGDSTPTTRELCIMRVNGKVEASLGSIHDADDDYRRVIEAELAAEYYLGQD